MGQPPQFVTTTELMAWAREHMSEAGWARLDGGAETETTTARNRLGFDTLAFQPRILNGVGHIDMSTEFLGRKLRIPVMPAPVGSTHLYVKDGHASVVRACEAFGTVPILSSNIVVATLEEIGAVSSWPKMFQLGISGDLEWSRDAIARARVSGYEALCLAFDTPRFGRMEREMMASHEPIRPTHPLRIGLDWETLPHVIAGAGMPLIAKGVTHPDDARRLVDMGFEVIYISNHGGHALDHGRGAIDYLPDIVNAVGGRAQVILDSGVQRGTDVLKAIALGATAVCIGRMQCFGLAAGGEAGLVRLLELFEEELMYAMTFLGTPSIRDVKPEHVVRDALPVTQPGLWSAFPHLGW
jgi:isopentenyl diphosphate isomerase/L-lactate dehydrogenase-like FMN-dependent dehydrogenase